MIGEIIRIILFVKDVKKSSEFYRDTFGFSIIGKIDPDWTEVSCKSCNIALHKSFKSSGITKDTGVKIVFGVKDVFKARALIESKGCKMGKIMEFGKLKFCDGTDPDGNVFQISDRE